MKFIFRPKLCVCCLVADAYGCLYCASCSAVLVSQGLICVLLADGIEDVIKEARDAIANQIKAFETLVQQRLCDLQNAIASVHSTVNYIQQLQLVPEGSRPGERTVSSLHGVLSQTRVGGLGAPRAAEGEHHLLLVVLIHTSSTEGFRAQCWMAQSTDTAPMLCCTASYVLQVSTMSG